MDNGFIAIIVAAAAILVLLGYKGALSRLKALVVAVILFISLIVYVLVCPSSPVSMWFTEVIAGSITIDVNNEHESGDVLFTWTTKSDESDTDEDEDASTQDDTDLNEAGLSQNFADRIVAIANTYARLEEQYTMTFADSYLVVEPDNYQSFTITIYKS